MIIVQVSVRQTEYTSRGMSYTYKIMLHYVHVMIEESFQILYIGTDLTATKLVL